MDTKCEESFQLLKKFLTSAPILKMLIQMKILWYALMLVKRELVEFSLKMGM
jgi:hypothetical protein